MQDNTVISFNVEIIGLDDMEICILISNFIDMSLVYSIYQTEGHYVNVYGNARYGIGEKFSC